jgi:hypothetical protein
MRVLIEQFIYSSWISQVAGYSVVLAAALCVIASIIRMARAPRRPRKCRDLTSADILLACSRARDRRGK